MARNFRQLEEKMSEDRRAKVQASVQREQALLLLAELCESGETSRERIAEMLGLHDISDLKPEDRDTHVGSLRRLIESMGGSLELIAHLPRGDIRIGDASGAR